ncbi:hypothetical protein ABCR94_12670 [Streptomyces sp. 21So2-11]|uniref:hypothetical protein n=1 Tax=Streptomyces sp. 21So2-11 TaxID=3144408 RepID=UPI00321B410B
MIDLDGRMTEVTRRPLVAGLIGELTTHHPLVGTLTVTPQTLQSPQGSGPAGG